jgi:hypothetical protein
MSLPLKEEHRLRVFASAAKENFWMAEESNNRRLGKNA